MDRMLRLEILKNFDKQADFAAAAGIHESKISQVIRGRRRLSASDANKWIKILKCDSAVLEPVIEKNKRNIS